MHYVLFCETALCTIDSFSYIMCLIHNVMFIELVADYDEPCFCPACLADPIHREDHHRNEDARARDDLDRAFGHANIDGVRAGEGPSNPHVIPFTHYELCTIRYALCTMYYVL